MRIDVESLENEAVNAICNGTGATDQFARLCASIVLHKLQASYGGNNCYLPAMKKDHDTIQAGHAKGMTKRQLARLFDLSEKQIGNIVNNRRKKPARKSVRPAQKQGT